MLAAKSIRTGWPALTGKPALAYSQAAFEQNGCNSRFRIGDEHRGQRASIVDRLNSARSHDRLTTESKRQSLWLGHFFGSACETASVNSMLIRFQQPGNYAATRIR